jgi:hypothetical protein
MFILIGIAIVAGVATLADYLWYSLGIRHTLMAGVVHGALLLSVVGAVLGAAHGRILQGLPIGAVAGVGGALIYYLLIAVFDGQTYGLAIPAAWVMLWLLLAALDGRWLRAAAPRGWREIAVRGVVAAVSSGAAFFMVLRVLWGRPPAGGRSYLVQFAAWALAWAPGLLALMVAAPARSATGRHDR